MGLLTYCQDAAREIGLAAPSSIIGSTSETARRMLRAAHRTGAVLAKKNWHELIKPGSITTSSGEPQYALPADYRSLVPDTVWNDTTDQQVFLSTPRMWTYEKAVLTSNYFDRFRLLGDDAGPSIGKKITIHPTPTATESITFEYYSKNWLTDSSGTTEKSAFTVDSDVVIFDEDLFVMGLVWRTLKAIGQPYTEEKSEYDQMVEITLAQSGGMETLRTDGNLPTLSNIPETGFGT